MDDALLLKDKIRFMIEIGESHFREFKSCLDGPPGEKKPRELKSVCVDIAQTLAAFANADGGNLLVGVEDDGLITGVPYDETGLQRLEAAPTTHIFNDTPLPLCKVKRLEFDGKLVLYFSVSAGTDFCYLTSDGRCLQRKDLSTVPVSSEYIKASKAETKSREYDREYVLSAGVKDLNLDLVRIVAEQLSHGMSPEKCLQHLDLAEFDETGLRLKRAALLLFATNIAKWHPRVQVRVLKVEGTELQSGENYNVTYDEQETANILTLIETSWELIRPHLVETRFSKDAKFKTQIIYPELACREALTNAIAHRDYSNEGRGIEVHIYNDRMEIINPGGLLSSISINDLKKMTGMHQSRNSLVARALKEAGYMRELGEGIRRIHDLMRQNDLNPPEFHTDHSAFRITLHQKYVYSKEEILWLDNFSSLELTRDQKTIVRLGYNGHVISAQEIWDACGIVDTDYYRQIVEDLDKLGILVKSLTHSEVILQARRRKLPKKQIPRYKISMPSKSVSRTAPDEDLAITDYSKIFIGNLPNDAIEGDILEEFSKFGEVESVFVPIDFYTQHNKGYAFVEYGDRRTAEKVIALSGDVKIRDRKLYINWAVPRK